jgi:glycosyltransferase involved in cell wall biosynthesis
VVDDASRDRTREIAVGLELRDPRVRVVIHESRLGRGAALRTGIAVATEPWILLVDADLGIDLSQLEEFIPLTSGHDLLLGWRVLRTAPLRTRLAAWGWNRLVDAVFAVHARDIDCPFKLVRRELVTDLQLNATSATFDAELVVRCLARGARIGQIGVRERAGRAAGRRDEADSGIGAHSLRDLASARWEIGRLRQA